MYLVLSFYWFESLYNHQCHRNPNSVAATIGRLETVNFYICSFAYCNTQRCIIFAGRVETTRAQRKCRCSSSAKPLRRMAALA